MIFIGWTPLTHKLKGWIRKILMVGNRRTEVSFSKELIVNKHKLTIITKIFNVNKNKFISMSIGDEFFVRYVPQSRFFQSQELYLDSHTLDKNDLIKLNSTNTFTLRKSITLI